MAAPLATEKVLRGILQSLQRGGLVSSGADVAKLEAIPNNATDADISVILDTMVFGGVATATDVVRGDDDVNVFIDADDSDATLVQQRYFRVAEDQSDPPVTDPDRELTTVSRRADGPTWRAAELIVGPRTSLATGNHRGSLKLGTDAGGHFGSLLGGLDAVGASIEGLNISSDTNVSLQADTAVAFYQEDGTNLRGGFTSMTTTTRFHVGDFLSSPQESMVIEKNIVASIPMYTFRPSYTDAAVRRVYFRGSNGASEYRSFWSFGGKAGETYGDPNNFNNSTFMVVGDDDSTTANAAYVYDRKTNRASGSEIFTIKANTAAGTAFSYLRVRTSANVGVFSVKGDGSVNGPAGFTTGAADVAEVITADAEYDPGTVLAIHDGGFTKTTDRAQTNVAGVVSTKPGMLLGNKEDGFPVDATTLAICGFVPVMCSTEQGDILGNGEFLVSGPNGTAVVDYSPKPGTIIGKAKGKLLSNGSGVVTGLVEALVNLQ